MNRIFDLKKYKDNIALRDELGECITYDTLCREAERIAEKIESRSLIFCLCKNEIGSIVGYVSFLENQIVPVLLGANIDEELLRNLLLIYQPRYVWVPKSEYKEFLGGDIIYESFNYLMLKYCDAITSLYGDLGLLLTTSGSTGSPKFVRQSYKNIKANTKSIIEYLELNDKERPITTLPMNYTYGLSIINTHLSVGATILLTEKSIMQKEFWYFFNANKATSFGGVPYTYEMLDKLKFYRMDLPSLSTMTQAGGKIIPELHEKFAHYATEQGKKFVVMYGACEATARMGYLPPDVAAIKRGAMGIPIPGGRFYLLGDKDEIITTEHKIGELVYEGENVALGYAENSKDLAKGDEWDGRLYTGDMAEVDEEGYYYIVGRKKRFLKIYGNRINVDEMEIMIKDKFHIDVACSGIDDKMYVFITDETLMNNIKTYVSKKTKLNPTAFRLVKLNTIPKNDSGKIIYRELEKYYL